MVKRVCLASGGTGGHLMPAVLLARALRERGHAPIIVTEGREPERVLLERFDGPTSTVPRAGRGLDLPLRLLGATMHARRFLRDEEIDLVVGTGGRATVPMALAASSLRLPVALLEQNAVTGRANRMLAPLAKRIYLGLPTRRAPRRALMTGTPVRDDVGVVERSEARRQLGLRADAPVVLVTGGSQGARVINEVTPAGLTQLRRPLQVLHLAGAADAERVRLRYAPAEDFGLRALVRSYAFDMATYYAAADLVICRGGGSTVAELAAAGRAAIIVPYPWHRDRQQYFNGRVLADAGAAIVVEQRDFDAQWLSTQVESLLGSERLGEMGRRSGSFLPRDACARILEDLRQLATLD
ncbi:MAG: UDP-N-acetylglucosamine--N-acetylmuramyl-(pentapeptide) pyrophosphoryl-undecaprenol N-acetylglucosamine transferase [Planctomycetota bacterium]